MLSVTQAAQRLGISPRRLRVLISQGRIPAERIGSQYALDEAEVQRFAAVPRKTGRPEKEEL